MTAAPPPSDPSFWQWIYDNVWAPIGGTTLMGGWLLLALSALRAP